MSANDNPRADGIEEESEGLMSTLLLLLRLQQPRYGAFQLVFVLQNQR
jgi:hypothetical protein